MRFPDPVLALSEEERNRRMWGNDQSMMQIEGVGAFVRVLLPIRLTGGYTLTLGTWLAIDPVTMPDVWKAWNTDRYKDMTLDGFLANGIPPWGNTVPGASAKASVRDPGEYPYVRTSSDVTLDRVLSAEWPHDEVLAPYTAL